MEQVEVETSFTCNGRAVFVSAPADESLLYVLRERLGIFSAKDGCAPQGQCGCCTVLVDGEPRVACVTPLARVGGRAVTTIEGLDVAERDRLADAFVATGGSQCGFCTPGHRDARVAEDESAISTGRWRRTCAGAPVGARCTKRFAVTCACRGARSRRRGTGAQSWRVASRRQSRRRHPARGRAFRRRHRAALRVALRFRCHPIRRRIQSNRGGYAMGRRLDARRTREPPRARSRAGAQRSKSVRRSTTCCRIVLLGACGLRRRGSSPRISSPDASWCEPGGVPASPYVNGGAFGGKLHSAAPVAARELADQLGETVRVVYSREDVVRLGPKRSPIAATAVWRDGVDRDRRRRRAGRRGRVRTRVADAVFVRGRRALA